MCYDLYLTSRYLVVLDLIEAFHEEDVITDLRAIGDLEELEAVYGA